jgi:hypothetical protein
MLNKMIFAFAGGALCAVGFTHSKPGGLLWLSAGILLTLLVQMALLAKLSRIERFARFLTSYAAAWRHNTPDRAVASYRARIAKDAEPGAASAEQPRLDSATLRSIVERVDPKPPAKVDDDLVSALRNMGASQKLATKAAAQATGENFEDRFRAAVTAIRN